jgi:transposase
MKTKIYYSSVDLHAERSVLGVMDKNGKMLTSERFATTREALEAEVSKWPKNSLILTVEMGPMTRWAVKILRPLCREVKVCNPRHNRLVSRNANKNDFADVEALCELLRINAIKTVWIGEDEGREYYRMLVNDLLGWRNQARRQKTLIKAKYRTFGLGECRGQEIYSHKGRVRYLDELPGGFERRVLGRLYNGYDLARANWKETLKEVEAQGRQYPEVAEFKKIAGIAEVGANVFSAFIEDPHRFPTESKLWRYCALGVTSRSSDGKPLGYERIDRTGNHELKNVSYTAWRTACKKTTGDNPVQRYYQASLERCGVVRRARLNTQRKIIKVMHTLWKKGVPYDPKQFSQENNLPMEESRKRLVAR